MDALKAKGKLPKKMLLNKRKRNRKETGHESEQVYISVHKVSQLFEVTLIPALYYCH